MPELLAGIVLLMLLRWAFRYCLFCKPVPYRHPRILMYHMVSAHKAGAKFNGLRVNPEQFEKQLVHMKENGWRSLTMKELMDKGSSVPEKTVVLTFDDGYEDNYTTAFPLLKKYGFKATLYLVIDRHNRDWSVYRKSKNNTGELKVEPKLNDAQVKEMVDSGVFEMGSHTISHANFNALSTEEIKAEVVDSKVALESLTGTNCDSFCYPFGIYKMHDWELIKTAGYSNATTTTAGISNFESDNLYLLKRVTVSGKDNMLAFKSKLKNGKRGVFK